MREVQWQDSATVTPNQRVQGSFARDLAVPHTHRPISVLSSSDHQSEDAPNPFPFTETPPKVDAISKPPRSPVFPGISHIVRPSQDRPSVMSYNDENKLASLGYKQEFKRVFSPLEVFGVAFSIIGLFPSIA